MKNNDTHALPLAIKSVSKYYGSTLAVDSVTFSLKKGEIFGLLGPNGAGKTTIISMITTLLPLSAGNIAVFGKSVVEFPIEVKKMTGVVCQEVAHLSYFSLERILRFYSGYYGLWNNREREQWLLDQLGLWSQRKKKCGN